VTDEDWLRRLSRNLAANGKFSGPRMAPGTSYDFLSQLRNRPIHLVAANAGLRFCHVGPAESLRRHIHLYRGFPTADQRW
jgi:hypothetical protein